MTNMPATMQMPYKIGINAPLVRREAKTAMVEGDRCANTIVIEVMDGLEPADLAGCSVSAIMKRSDGARPYAHGTVEGNVVTVCLNESFYAVPGGYELLVRLTHTDGTKRVILWLHGWINDEGQGDLIDTENVVPDLEDLLAQIDAMEQATAAANAAAANVEGFKAEVQQEVGQLSEEIAKAKNEIIVNSDGVLQDSTPVEEAAFSTGKYISVNVGGVWNNNLIDNPTSLYTPESIDTSAYIGGKIKISLSETNPNGGRCIGFCDSNGVVSRVLYERHLVPPLAVYNTVSGLYEVFLDVADTNFFFSLYSGSFAKIELIMPKNIYNKDEVDAQFEELEAENAYTSNILKCAVGMEEKTVPHSVAWGSSSGRDRLNAHPTAEYATAISVQEIEGYQVAFFYVKDGAAAVATGWVTSIEKLDIPNCDNYYISFRKEDNSAFTSSEIAFVQSNAVIYCHYNYNRNREVGYVSPSGSDNNDGLTRSTPFATIQKAVDSGFKTILVKEGTYSGSVTMVDKTNITIALDRYYDTFAAGTDEDNPKIIIDGAENALVDGVTVARCANCHFESIEVKNCAHTGWNIKQSEGLRFDDCIAHDMGVDSPSGYVGGFVMVATDADFYNCEAYNIGTTMAGTATAHCDGFNIHYTGTVNLYNCKAWNCEDDGVSHHDACCGVIDGGEWYNCGKGGIASPTHGAKVNVKNVYSHDNVYGLLAASDGNVISDRGNILISNCVFNNNTTDVMCSNDYKLVVFNCVYDTVTGADNIVAFN